MVAKQPKFHRNFHVMSIIGGISCPQLCEYDQSSSNSRLVIQESTGGAIMILSSILFPVLSLGGMGILFGLGLGYAEKKFRIDESPSISAILEILPHANCGACGFAGCNAFASAVASGNAEINACSVGGASVVENISIILGVQATTKEREVAYVRCGGDCDNAHWQYQYEGLNNCHAIAQLPAGGTKKCSFGCLGAGSCAYVCPFDAIKIENSIATIDSEKCKSCGRCVKECPNNLIIMLPHKNKIHVACNSADNGKITRSSCKVGCIACKMCEKVCKFDAIKVDRFHAKIDYNKCVSCKMCIAKCPTKAIINTSSPK